MDVIEEGTALHSSYGQDRYCEEVFLTTVQNFAHSVKKISDNLDKMEKEAIVSHKEKTQQNLHNADAESVNIERDPGSRKGMKLNEKEKQYLISKGRYQPCLEKYPPARRFQKKQSAFSAKWYEKYPFLEYSPKTNQAFCYTFCLFGDGAGPTETNRSTEGVNRWDKMKSRGKKKAGKLQQHFTSASHKLSAEKFHSFNKKEICVLK